MHYMAKVASSFLASIFEPFLDSTGQHREITLCQVHLRKHGLSLTPAPAQFPQELLHLMSGCGNMQFLEYGFMFR